MIMFKVGDAIMHPIRGAGIIMDLMKRQWHGNDEMYYKVKLLSHPGSNLMIPTRICHNPTGHFLPIQLQPVRYSPTINRFDCFLHSLELLTLFPNLNLVSYFDKVGW